MHACVSANTFLRNLSGIRCVRLWIPSLNRIRNHSMLIFPHPGVVFTSEHSVSSVDAVWRASDIEKRASVNRTLLKLIYISGVTDNHQLPQKQIFPKDTIRGGRVRYRRELSLTLRSPRDQGSAFSHEGPTLRPRGRAG